MKRNAPLRRTAIKRRVTAATRKGRELFAQSGDVVAERAGYRCEGCGRAAWLRRHHRQPRQAGGSRAEYVNLPSNLLMLCHACDDVVENSGRTDAKDWGWLLKRGQDPKQVPVLLADGRRVLLDDDGNYLPVTDEQREAS